MSSRDWRVAVAPMLELGGFFGQLPAASIGVGEGAFAFGFLFGEELGRQFPANFVADLSQRGVQIG